MESSYDWGEQLVNEFEDGPLSFNNNEVLDNDRKIPNILHMYTQWFKIIDDTVGDLRPDDYDDFINHNLYINLEKFKRTIIGRSKNLNELGISL